MKYIIFDIETGPLDEKLLRAMMPAFDPLAVKYGNTKDESKRAAKLNEARTNHESNWFDRAALSAESGKVLAIGYQIIHNGQPEPHVNVFASGNEAEDIKLFWDLFTSNPSEVRVFVGFNIFHFDIPFLIRRSWRLGLSYPRRKIRRGRWWQDDNLIDLMEEWQMGSRQEYISLDRLAMHVGAGAKSGSGKDFAGLFNSDREAAIAYLENDVRMTAKAAQQMGVV